MCFTMMYVGFCLLIYATSSICCLCFWLLSNLIKKSDEKIFEMLNIEKNFSEGGKSFKCQFRSFLLSGLDHTFDKIYDGFRSRLNLIISLFASIESFAADTWFSRVRDERRQQCYIMSHKQRVLSSFSCDEYNKAKPAKQQKRPI